jgi:hypothetical protein
MLPPIRPPAVAARAGAGAGRYLPTAIVSTRKEFEIMTTARHVIADTPFWHDPDEPLAEVVGLINADRLLRAVDKAGFNIERKAEPSKRRQSPVKTENPR